MKKLKILFCAGALAFCLAACGNTKDDGGSQGAGQSGAQDGSGAAQGSTGAADGSGAAHGSTGAADGSGAAQGNSGASDAAGGQQDNSGALDGSGTQSGSGPENGGAGVLEPQEVTWSEEMGEIRAAVAEALGEDYWPDMPMDAEMFELFFGIGPDMYEDYMAESPMISANVDTLVIVKAKEDTADAVEEALNTYRDNKVNDTMQYPQNIGKIQASQVVRIGNYVVFVQLGADTPSDNDEAAITQCQEDNEQVIGIIRQYVEQ